MVRLVVFRKICFVFLSYFLVFGYHRVICASTPTLFKLNGASKIDLFLIGGKNCNSPTIIKQGKKSVFGRGKSKLILIEPECKTYGGYMKKYETFGGEHSLPLLSTKPIMLSNMDVNRADRPKRRAAPPKTPQRNKIRQYE